MGTSPHDMYRMALADADVSARVEMTYRETARQLVREQAARLGVRPGVIIVAQPIVQRAVQSNMPAMSKARARERYVVDKVLTYHWPATREDVRITVRKIRADGEPGMRRMHMYRAWEIDN